MRINVQDGTNAGWKRPLGESRRAPWTCSGCGRVNQSFVVRCLTGGCTVERPT